MEQVEVVDPLARLRDAIDGLLAADPSALADGATVLGLAAEAARLELVASQQASTFASGLEWSVEGAYNASSWVTAKARCPRWLARRRERLGRAVRAMPHTAAAWSAGKITAEHVDVLVAARTPKVVDTFARDEEMLVGFALEMSHAKFVHAVEYWVQQAMPDEAEKRAEAQRDHRAVFNSQSYQGLWFGKLTLDPIGGEIFDAELRRIEKALFDDEWARVKAVLGHDPLPGDLERTAAQRRADALVEMATRSRTMPKHGKRPAPLFTVLVDYDTLAGRVCELASRTVVTPGSLVPWLDTAYVERIVFDGKGRLLDVGKRRRFSGAQNAAASRSETVNAPTRCARSRPRTAMSTTSSPTPPAARRPSTTAGHSATSTTGSATPSGEPVHRRHPMTGTTAVRRRRADRSALAAR